MMAQRVLGLEKARQRWGPRADEVAAAYAVGDPVADAAVEAAQDDLDGARRAIAIGLDGGAVHGSAALQRFVEECRTPLSWQDRGQCGRAAERLRDLGPWLAIVLRCYALPLAYASPVGNKPLAMTGRLVADTQQRLTTTARFVWSTQTPGAMRVGASGWRACVWVRWTHAMVRAGLRMKGWPGDWGAPMPQPDLAATGLLFGVKAVEGLRELGVEVSDADADAIAHLYRVVSARVGVQPRLQSESYAAGSDLFSLLTALQPKPDADSVRLTLALLQPPVPSAAPLHRRMRAPLTQWFFRGVAGGLLGPTARTLGLPSGRRRFASLRFVARRAWAPLPGQDAAIRRWVLGTEHSL